MKLKLAETLTNVPLRVSDSGPRIHVTSLQISLNPPSSQNAIHTHYSSLRRITNRRCRRRRSWSLISSLTTFSKLRHGISLSLSSFSLTLLLSLVYSWDFLCSSSRTISLLSIVSSVLSSKTINGGAYSAAGYLISERSLCLA